MKKPNRLINESSPYLLQHAFNPVDWYSWCDEAFEKARSEDKPIFLSIGYSTCHWCHVMEKESFEDEQVAELMNRVFVSIKVDREERPDIDHVYMMTCQLINGNGGWPLSIIMTPDKKPFFAGTYIPKENRYGRVGFIELIKKIESLWMSNRKEILENSDQITQNLKQLNQKETEMEISEGIFEKVFHYFVNRFDNNYGGFGAAPKFPSPHNLMFLLRHYKKTGKKESLEMVIKTLTEMRMGGIYDQVGFGFHRYSTDNKWLVPHFEKMLYDQATLIIAFSEAFQITRQEIFKDTVEEIFEYIRKKMLSANGGFYSAEDADSEGIEGKFYVWTHQEIIDVLGKDNAEFAFEVFNIDLNGNYHDESTRKLTGNNILHLNKPHDKLANELNFSKDQFKTRINEIREKLFVYREQRIHPLKDEKILTDWNSLLIASLAIAGRIFNNPEFTKLAQNCLRFLLTNLSTSNGGILHMFKNGKGSIKANLDDYSFLIYALTELYQTTFNIEYIKSALELYDYTCTNFWDNENGGFFFTEESAESLIIRTKEFYDGAIPSGNSVMFFNLIRLARISSRFDLEEYANQLIKTFSANINRTPYGTTFLVSSYDFFIGNSYELVITAPQYDQSVKDVLQELNNIFLPNKVVILNIESEQPLFEYLREYKSISGKPTFYICKNYKCELPTTILDEALSLLNA
jgi:hypothetical protein